MRLRDLLGDAVARRGQAGRAPAGAIWLSTRMSKLSAGAVMVILV